MADWWSIEICDGDTTAAAWRTSYGEALSEAALASGTGDWAWHEFPWGIVLELEFADEEAWARFRSLPLIQAALDAVPDPVNGFFVYRGRGGSAGVRTPRRPVPLTGAGAVSLPEPEREVMLDVIATELPAIERDLAGSVRRPGRLEYMPPATDFPPI
jgi:hypothetical protein